MEIEGIGKISGIFGQVYRTTVISLKLLILPFLGFNSPQLDLKLIDLDVPVFH